MSVSTVLSVVVLSATAALAPAAAHAVDGQVDGQATHSPGVLIVKQRQLVDTGHGVDLKLTRTERCVGTPGDWNCKSVADGNQAPGSVSLQSRGDASGTLYTPLYIGAGKAARMTVATNGATYHVRVVTLAGRPGYSTGYVWGAPENRGPVPGFTHVTVYNAAGKVLAQL